MSVTITASLLGTVLSFLVVTAATYVTTSLLSDGSSVVYSLFTAGITSVVWFGVTYLISGVVGVGGYAVAAGPALAVVAYILAVDLLYENGLGQAVAISIGTWTVSFAILYAAAYFGYSSFQAIGVPPGI
ncbi:hypothetical protein NDI76_12125 [Halogeometricum sp. S1BR25-6]|uniref:Uncharacterized protein n=1 Tax=Halogeometricum salsisoli TaxID=2950536 RepID=A0ABU2GFD8_9EURY|nr:hypothetical protein [Halogeometricum sp. S1BR25-6]MDS0299489.1 hypothetical protein [Halogeometricum sp. S1BR25-6]